jgi:Spy/CpxP family protein refolding chaperone
MRKKIFIAAAVLVVAGAGLAAAHGGRATPEQRAERLVERATKELSLDAAQKEQFTKLVAEFRPVVEQLRAAREETRGKLGTQLKAGAVDAEAMKAAVRGNLAGLQKSADQLIDRVAVFYATLTPAQKAKVAETFQKLDDWRGGEGRGGCGECDGGGRHGRGRHGAERCAEHGGK